MLNVDTNIVIFLLDDKLSPFEAEAVRHQPLGISAMVLWEIAKLHQLGRLKEGLEDARMATFLKSCHVWPIDAQVALVSTRLDFRSDLADEIIAATSVVHRVPLLTRDERLLTSKIVPLLRLEDD